MLRNKKAQSTLEYVILVTAVIVVMIAFLTKSDGPFQKTLNTSLNTVTGKMSDAAERWTDSTACMAR